MLVAQVSLSGGLERDVLLLCQCYFMCMEYHRALHLMEGLSLCSSDNPEHIPFIALTAQCLVCLCLFYFIYAYDWG